MMSAFKHEGDYKYTFILKYCGDLEIIRSYLVSFAWGVFL